MSPLPAWTGMSPLRCRGLMGTVLLTVLAGLFALSLALLDQVRTRALITRRSAAAGRHDGAVFRGFDAWVLAHQQDLAARLAQSADGPLAIARWPGEDGQGPDPLFRSARFAVIADPSGRQLETSAAGPLPVALMAPGPLPASADRSAWGAAVAATLGRRPAEDDAGRAALMRALTGRPVGAGDRVLRADRDILRDGRFLYRRPIPGRDDLARMEVPLEFASGTTLSGAGKVQAQGGDFRDVTAQNINIQALEVTHAVTNPYGAHFYGDVTLTGPVDGGLLNDDIGRLEVAGSLHAKTTVANKVDIKGDVSAQTAFAPRVSSSAVVAGSLSAKSVQAKDMTGKSLMMTGNTLATTVEAGDLGAQSGQFGALHTDRCYGCKS